MKTKKLALLSLTALSVIGLASCGNNDSNALKITFWHNSSNEDAILSAIESFKKIEPNVTVESVKQSGSYDDMKTNTIQGLAADNYPDIFYGYPDSVCELMDYGVVAKLDAYIDDENIGWTAEQKADIVDNYLKESQSYPIDGTYSLPFAKSTEAMYYNRAILGLDMEHTPATGISLKEKYGLTCNKITEDYLNNLTWEELFGWNTQNNGGLCGALIEFNNSYATTKFYYPDNYDFHGVFGYDSDDNLFITLCEQYGTGYTSLNKTTHTGELLFNNDANKAMLKKLRTAVKNEYLITKGSNSLGKYTNYAFVEQASLFSVGSTGGAKYQVSDDFDVGVAKIPHKAGSTPKVINQGPSIAILTHTKDKEARVKAAWKFYKHYCEKYSVSWSVNTGYFPITKSGYSSDEFLEALDESKYQERTLEKTTARIFQYSTKITNDYYLSPVFKGSATARTQVGGLTTSVLKDDLTDAQINTLFDTAVENVKKKM